MSHTVTKCCQTREVEASLIHCQHDTVRTREVRIIGTVNKMLPGNARVMDHCANVNKMLPGQERLWIMYMPARSVRNERLWIIVHCQQRYCKTER